MAKVITTELQHSGASSANITLAADGSVTLPSDTVDEAKLKVSNAPTNGQFLSAQSGNTGGLTWAAAGAGGSSNVAFNSSYGLTWDSGNGYIKGYPGDAHRLEFNVGGNLNQYRFKFGGTEKMRWHSDSTVAWGSSPSTGATNGYNSNQGVWLYGTALGSDDIVIGTVAVSAAGAAVILNRSNDTNGTVAIFRKAGSTKGTIAVDGSSTAYNTSSDYRLKENQVAISDGITRVKTLKPYRFNFKVEPSKTVDGFFAHEVTAVPEAIFGTKDAMKGETFYEEGDTLPSGKKVGDVKTYSSSVIDAQQIDQSKLVPLLTAALQEAITKIETLETKVAALEAG